MIRVKHSQSSSVNGFKAGPAMSIYSLPGSLALQDSRRQQEFQEFYNVRGAGRADEQFPVDAVAVLACEKLLVASGRNRNAPVRGRRFAKVIHDCPSRVVADVQSNAAPYGGWNLD